MADEVTNTVKSVSDGTVSITIERYEELLKLAAEKAPVIYNTMQKTEEMVAQDNKIWGGILIGGGVCLSVIGTALHLLGRAQEKALKAN